MRKWLRQRHEHQDITLQEGEAQQESDTLSQLARSKCLNHRLQCQLTAAQGRIADLTAENDYLRRLRQYERSRARDEVRKLMAEIHALQSHNSYIPEPKHQFDRARMEQPQALMDRSELHMDGN
ncbi:hypothetical protein HIM_07748 [Hirsutella minnesotensis 3608]|uniref:Uncharacterized protein n=1 Tax=Hirsutella minnesotensis 3608 TaxID=1043627 RepID=A0A0F8A418_9HYPO|nr:hypothetical protein HIM_12640 [Hirsutella minnesotensis 3608]KJZ72804.1 hypothetical protein HIM_07748 [Hirsutella minnesotensis 3608]